MEKICLKPFYIARVLLIMVVFLLVNASMVLAVLPLDITPISCPDRTSEGKRTPVDIVIDNTSNEKLEISNLTLGIDKSVDSNNTSTGFIPSDVLRYPISLLPRQEFNLKGKFVSKDLGFHYLDLVIYYSVNGTASKISEEVCQMEVISIDATDNLPFPLSSEIFYSALIFPAAVGVAAALIKRYYTNKDFDYQERLKSMLNRKDIQLTNSLNKKNLESQEKLQHENWLLQHMHNLASKYYSPMAKFAYQASWWLEISSSSE
jgi:hypothetical protein